MEKRKFNKLQGPEMLASFKYLFCSIIFLLGINVIDTMGELHPVGPGELKTLEIQCITDYADYCLKKKPGFIFHDGCRYCICGQHEVKCRKGACTKEFIENSDVTDYCNKVENKNEKTYETFIQQHKNGPMLQRSKSKPPPMHHDDPMPFKDGKDDLEKIELEHHRPDMLPGKKGGPPGPQKPGPGPHLENKDFGHELDHRDINLGPKDHGPENTRHLPLKKDKPQNIRPNGPHNNPKGPIQHPIRKPNGPLMNKKDHEMGPNGPNPFKDEGPGPKDMPHFDLDPRAGKPPIGPEGPRSMEKHSPLHPKIKDIGPPNLGKKFNVGPNGRKPMNDKHSNKDNKFGPNSEGKNFDMGPHGPKSKGNFPPGKPPMDNMKPHFEEKNHNKGPNKFGPDPARNHDFAMKGEKRQFNGPHRPPNKDFGPDTPFNGPQNHEPRPHGPSKKESSNDGLRKGDNHERHHPDLSLHGLNEDLDNELRDFMLRLNKRLIKAHKMPKNMNDPKEWLALLTKEERDKLIKLEQRASTKPLNQPMMLKDLKMKPPGLFFKPNSGKKTHSAASLKLRKEKDLSEKPQMNQIGPNFEMEDHDKIPDESGRHQDERQGPLQEHGFKLNNGPRKVDNNNKHKLHPEGPPIKNFDFDAPFENLDMHERFDSKLPHPPKPNGLSKMEFDDFIREKIQKPHHPSLGLHGVNEKLNSELHDFVLRLNKRLLRDHKMPKHMDNSKEWLQLLTKEEREKLFNLEKSATQTTTGASATTLNQVSNKEKPNFDNNLELEANGMIQDMLQDREFKKRLRNDILNELEAENKFLLNEVRKLKGRLHKCEVYRSRYRQAVATSHNSGTGNQKIKKLTLASLMGTAGFLYILAKQIF